MDEKGTSFVKGRRGILLLASCLVALALPASASALTYCVSDPSCVAAGGMNMGSNLQAALTTAQGTAADDRIQIGAGTFVSPSNGYVYSAGAGNSVEVDGAGDSATTLTAPIPPVVPGPGDTSVTTLTVAGAEPDNSISDLAVVATGAMAGEFPSHHGIDLNGGGTIERVAVTATPGSFGTTGITVTGTVRDSVVSVGNAGGRAAVRPFDGTPATIEDSVLSGYYGVYGDSNGSTATQVKVSRVGMQTLHGVYTLGSNVTVEDSVVAINDPSGDAGISAYTRPMLDVSTIVRNSTIVGAGTGTQTGIDAVANSSGRTATVSVNSSVIADFSTALRRAGSLGTANLSVAYSNYDDPVDSSGAGAFVDGAGNTSFADPGFVDPGDSDYALLSSSPLRDIGDPAAIAGESPTDLAGAPRISNGRRDMGAFEFQAPPVPAQKCAGKAVTLLGTAGKDTLTGTVGADVIAALGGKDVVRGLGANDVACGGAGNDRLIGGGGRDTLLGQAGKDLIKGGAKRDVLKGGGGRDRMVGGPGRDKLRGGPGRDRSIQ